MSTHGNSWWRERAIQRQELGLEASGDDNEGETEHTRKAVAWGIDSPGERGKAQVRKQLSTGVVEEQ